MSYDNVDLYLITKLLLKYTYIANIKINFKYNYNFKLNLYICMLYHYTFLIFTRFDLLKT